MQSSLTAALPLPATVWWTGLTPDAGYDVSAQPGSDDVTFTIKSGTTFAADAAGLLVVSVATDGVVTQVYDSNP